MGQKFVFPYSGNIMNTADILYKITPYKIFA